MARNAYVKTVDGWEQIATSVSAAAQGLAPIVPTSVTNGSFTGDGQITVSAQASVTINGIFSSKFDNYVVQFVGSGTGPTLLCRFASGGVVATTDAWGYGQSFTTTTANGFYIGSNTATNGVLGNLSTLANGVASRTEIFSPFLAQPKLITGDSVTTNASAGDGRGYYWGRNTTSTSRDGLNLFVASGTFTGTIRVYGYSSLAQPLSIPTPSPNYIINGAFDIWQRGTANSNTFTNPAAFAFTADRWFHNQDGTGDKTITRQSFAVNEVPVAGDRSNFFYRYSQTTAGTGTTYRDVLIHKVEDVRTLAGKTVTLSFWAKTDSTRNLQTYIGQDFGTGGSPSTVNYKTGATKSIGTGWTQYSTTVTLDSLSGKTIGTNGDSNLAIIIRTLTNNATQTVDVWGVQLEEGSIATPFRRNSPNLQAELAACQRYYERIYEFGATGFQDNSSIARGVGAPYFPKRTTPSISASSAMSFGISARGTDQVILASNANIAVIAESYNWRVTYAASTVTAGEGLYFYMAVPDFSTKYLEFDSEL